MHRSAYRVQLPSRDGLKMELCILGAYGYVYECVKRKSVVKKWKHTKKIKNEEGKKKYITAWGGNRGEETKKTKQM